MSASFIAVAFTVAVLLVNWRLVLLVAAACLVALIAFGIGVVVPEGTTAPSQGVVQTNPANSASGDVGPSHTR